MGLMLPRWRGRVNEALQRAAQGHQQVFDTQAITEASSWASCGIGEAYQIATGSARSVEEVEKAMDRARDPLTGANLLRDLGLQFYNAVFAQNAEKAHGLLSRMEGIEQEVLQTSIRNGGNGYKATVEKIRNLVGE